MTKDLDASKEYELKAKKPDGKFWGYGRLSVNQWGNWGIGMKVTDELMNMLEAKRGQYVNFSVFEREKDKFQKQEEQRRETPDNDTSIPF